MRRFILLLWCFPIFCWAQHYHLPKGEKYQKVKFELVNNLMIIPVEVNGTKLSFIFDSGVGKPILFNLSNQDSIQLNNVTEISLRGLGTGESVKALSSKGNTFKIGDGWNNKQMLYVILDKELNFSPNLGIPVHGIIGYDLFRDFIVDIDYANKVIKFYNPDLYTYKKRKNSETLPLAVRGKKSYLEGTVSYEDKDHVPVRLLIDTGSSDAVWLLEDGEKGLEIPDKNYEDFLGRGLSGEVYGRRTKINNIQIGHFVLENAKAAFPHLGAFDLVSNLDNRNGSLGGELLKRFNIVFDYPNGKITLKKNKYFKTPFQYNMSGLDLQHNGLRYIAEKITNGQGVMIEKEKSFGDVQILFENTTRLSLVPEIIVSGIRAGSPADEAGLQEGDVILAVNGKSIYKYKLQEVMKMLNEKEGKRIQVLVERYNTSLKFSFVLKDLFK